MSLQIIWTLKAEKLSVNIERVKKDFYLYRMIEIFWMDVSIMLFLSIEALLMFKPEILHHGMKIK